MGEEQERNVVGLELLLHSWEESQEPLVQRLEHMDAAAKHFDISRMEAEVKEIHRRMQHFEKLIESDDADADGASAAWHGYRMLEKELDRASARWQQQLEHY